MRIDVFTIFPDLVEGFAGAALLGKARERQLLDLRVHDLRSETTDVHRTVDDSPFGGGAGMVLMPEPIFAAVEAADPPRPLYLLGPGGRRLDQAMARELATGDGFSLLCGRYEGIDARVAEYAAQRMRVDEISLGDYVLAGGEVAVLVIAEAVSRLLPGVLGNTQSAVDDSFGAGPDGLLEAPAYTKPASWRGLDVPQVLLSGHHGEIASWRAERSRERTAERRPDLLS